MQPLSVDEYSEAEIRLALHSSLRTIGFRYELLNTTHKSIGWLDGLVEKAHVSHNALANIKRTARFIISDTKDINWLSDRIRPWFRLKMDNGWATWPLGVFLLSTPGRILSNGRVIREIEAYDQGAVLRSDKTVDRYTLASGTIVTSAIRVILIDAGIISISIQPSSQELTTDRDWPPGENWNIIVNDLLGAIGYTSLSFNSKGVAVASPYRDPDERPIGYQYTANESSVIVPELEHEFDLFDVANKWVGVVSEPDVPPLVSTLTNDHPSSPTSTLSRGRTIVDFRDNMEATSQASLDAQILRIAFEASQVYEAVEFSTALMPHHEDAELLVLSFGQEVPSTRYVEHTWDMDLQAGAKMKHRVRRLVSI